MSSRRQDNLLAALQRKSTVPADLPPSVPAPAAIPASLVPAASSASPSNREVPPPVSRPAPKTGRGKVGMPVQFWLHDEDRQLVREIAAWLAGQGIRPTDSMVVRAALRMAKTGPGLLDAYRRSALLDGRLKTRA